MHDRQFRPSPAVRASISDDGLVLLDLAGGLVLSSNVIGGRIWELIGQRRTPAEIARQLAVEYSVSNERTDADVTVFIAALLARGIVTEESHR